MINNETNHKRENLKRRRDELYFVYRHRETERNDRQPPKQTEVSKLHYRLYSYISVVGLLVRSWSASTCLYSFAVGGARTASFRCQRINVLHYCIFLHY